jgi:hypothetical protein
MNGCVLPYSIVLTFRNPQGLSLEFFFERRDEIERPAPDSTRFRLFAGRDGGMKANSEMVDKRT